MAFALTPKQAEGQRLLRSPQRHTLFYGGGRSGKTLLVVRAIVTRALIANDSRHAILRLRGNAARSSVALDTLPKVMNLCYPGVPLIERQREGFWEFPNGSQVWIGGLDEKERSEKILGQEFATIYLNECSQILHSSVLIARTRLAQVVEVLNPTTGKTYILPQRMYYDLNPVGTKHWSYQEFVLKRDPESGTPLKNPDQFAFMRINPQDNQRNLTAEMLAEYEALPERQRKRFFLGDYASEIDGALWEIETLERARIDGIEPERVLDIVKGDRYHPELPTLHKIVVAVDPSGTRGDENRRSNSVGIVVAGTDADGIGYVLEDLTCSLPPAQWAQVVVKAFHKWGADRVVAESNFGGAMVEEVIRHADRDIPYVEVSASRGKWVRAEPISSLYPKGRVFHVGRFPQLEDELLNFSTSGYLGERSPDRADAMVWGLTDLMSGDGFDMATFIKANS